jgi:hypothetical protein
MQMSKFTLPRIEYCLNDYDDQENYRQGKIRSLRIRFAKRLPTKTPKGQSMPQVKKGGIRTKL